MEQALQKTPTAQTLKRLAKKQQLGGRPTKYKPEYCEAIIKFFDVEPYTQQVFETSEENFKDGTFKKKVTKSRLVPNKMPTLYRFAESIGVSIQTLHEWKEQHAEFSHAFTRAKEIVKEFVITNGMAGSANPQFAIFVAKNVTDMRDKVENETPINLQVFFVPKEIAQKHNLQLPEATPPQRVEVVDITHEATP